MPDAIIVPSSMMREREVAWNLAASTVSPGQSSFGNFQIVRLDGGGVWTAQWFDVSVMTAAHVRTFRSIAAQAENGATPLVVSRCESRQRLPGTLATVAGATALRATDIKIALTAGAAIQAGEIFSISHPNQGWRMYEIKSAVATGGGQYLVSFRPPLREAAANGDKVEFDSPRCTMRLASPSAMNLSLDLRKFGAPSVDFVEYFYPAPAPSVFGNLVADRINMLFAAGNGKGLAYGLEAPDFSFTSATVPGWLVGTSANLNLSPGQSSPDDLNAATLIVPDTASNFHRKTQSITRQGARAISYRAAAYVKAAGYTRCYLLVTTSATDTAGCMATFDLAAGTVAIAAATYGSGWTAPAASITRKADGWFLVTVDGTCPAASASIGFSIGVDAGNDSQAANRTFVGDGVNGLYLWRCSLLPTAVWTALAGTRLFFDDFALPATVIDFDDTRSADYKFFRHNAWPAATSTTSPARTWATAPPTQVGDIVADVSKITLATDRSGFAEGLATAAANPAGAGYVGKAFSLPALFECRASWDPALHAGTAGRTPSMWTWPVEHLTGAITTQITDAQLFAAAVADGVPIASTRVASTAGVVNQQARLAAAYANPITDLNVWSTLWLTQAVNGGIGYMQHYYNGLFVPNGDLAYSSVADSAPSSGLGVGTFTAADAQTHVLMLGAGLNWPITYDWVAVWK